jgi:trehalose synthase
VNERSAEALVNDYDVYIVHDPQPAALRHFTGPRNAKWIWRCHIDSSSPDQQVSGFLQPYLEEYDAVVFTMADFLLPGLRAKRAAFIAPAIDPFATKNMDLSQDLCRRAIADSGVDPTRPLLVQVSRFDPWKDPMGVIEAYRLVKQEIPDVQLALIGAMAGDDPEGWELLDRVEEEAARDTDMFVFTNLAGVGNMEVNVFQRGCNVVIQKSLREGFGLVVSEAFWKEKPVVAGKAGGIPMQCPEGFEANLVDSVEACASRVLKLLRQSGERDAFGRAGREHVRRHFLLPRLVRDELRLIKQLID